MHENPRMHHSWGAVHLERSEQHCLELPGRPVGLR